MLNLNSFKNRAAGAFSRKQAHGLYRALAVLGQRPNFADLSGRARPIVQSRAMGHARGGTNGPENRVRGAKSISNCRPFAYTECWVREKYASDRSKNSL